MSILQNVKIEGIKLVGDDPKIFKPGLRPVAHCLQNLIDRLIYRN